MNFRFVSSLFIYWNTEKNDRYAQVLTNFLFYVIRLNGITARASESIKDDNLAIHDLSSDETGRRDPLTGVSIHLLGNGPFVTNERGREGRFETVIYFWIFVEFSFFNYLEIELVWVDNQRRKNIFAISNCSAKKGKYLTSFPDWL